MRKVWQGIVRTIFWSFERGSWPYDLMVVAIVLFVLLTPRTLFHDQPQSVALASSDVQLLSEDGENQTRTYRLDAKILRPEKRAKEPTPELERETHDILSRAVDDLKKRTFQVTRIDPLRAPDGSVVYYDVTVRLLTERFASSPPSFSQHGTRHSANASNPLCYHGARFQARS
jgi:hypothetical protein